MILRVLIARRESSALDPLTKVLSHCFERLNADLSLGSNPAWPGHTAQLISLETEDWPERKGQCEEPAVDGLEKCGQGQEIEDLDLLRVLPDRSQYFASMKRPRVAYLAEFSNVVANCKSVTPKGQTVTYNLDKCRQSLLSLTSILTAFCCFKLIAF